MAKLGPYKVHPVAAIFPMLDNDALKELADDIKIHGLQEPIVLNHDETVLVDGRNRYTACRKAGVEPDAVVLDDTYTDEDLRDYIVSKNLKRRHLTTGQKAMLATELLPFFEATAKRGRRWHKVDDPPPLLLPEDDRKSRAKAGAAIGVSGRSVTTAKAIKRDTPDLAKRVAGGQMSLDAADKERKQRGKGNVVPINRKAEQRSGATEFSTKIQKLSASLAGACGDLTDQEIEEALGAAQFLYELLRGETILRKQQPKENT